MVKKIESTGLGLKRLRRVKSFEEVASLVSVWDPGWVMGPHISGDGVWKTRRDGTQEKGLERHLRGRGDGQEKARG